MANPKIYLNVPYAQKDAAKALGAKWDAANKKWYVPTDKDVTLFAKWQAVAASEPSAKSKPAAQASFGKSPSSTDSSVHVAITKATDKNFVAYNGDTPPWD